MKGILFLCVANSARSQMAEGLARTMLPPGIEVWSAGSRPASVRPEAIAVLKEIGVDISHHRSKAVAEIPAAEVDTVITLCGEEECPLFLGRATRLHWGLPDPAAVTGSEQDRLNAFRHTRDELRRRLETLVAGKLDPAPTIFTDAVKELVAIGAAIGSNCEMCFKHHYNEARKLGVSKEDVRLAVAMAEAVKAIPARSISRLADRYLREPAAQASSCCCGPSPAEESSPENTLGERSCC